MDKKNQKRTTRNAKQKTASKKAVSTKIKRPAVDTPVEKARLQVNKTYKLYINGKFPRTESARYYNILGADGSMIANMCRASRKDFREAVLAARKAQLSWSNASAYLRGQILYRIAEMLEGRADQFAAELCATGASKSAAAKEVTAAIDCLVYYAGWTDKYQQIFSSVNPVASSHFNFSILEPMGVISVLCAPKSSLLGFISDVAPLIAGGNTLVALASESAPLSAISLAEVLHSSDVPAGVVNILTGYRAELVEQFASHMDVNAVVYNGDDTEEIKLIEEQAAANIKRVIIRRQGAKPGPYQISQAQEVKTTWHPIGN